jgi:AraC-like DNA-binding protein
MFRGLLIVLDLDTPRSGGSAAAPWEWAEVTRYIQEHLHEMPAVEQLARHFGYSRSHFSRLFRRRLGLSPQQYIINARLALAKELLRATALPIGHVARQAGYNDVYRFSKQFRQLVGRSPTDYRAHVLSPAARCVTEPRRRESEPILRQQEHKKTNEKRT